MFLNTCYTKNLFCFGNLMVRRKKMLKGCRKREKIAEKSKKESYSHWSCLLFILKQPSLVTEIIFVSH